MKEILEKIEQKVKEHPVVLFMKGTPEEPLCGFSAETARILRTLDVEFHAVDVIGEPEYREAVKAYSNWPTIPQLFIAGEFIGGCDITRQLYQSGELQRKLSSLSTKEKE
ncbi:MAG: Grx4 family monothiol glutaredoxin [Candidatus Hydrogenedentota bacterium]|nr:MAG: Grx4 family monothiol glutaredoxin [Candidatus Hydrogenedentota bacterium]